MPVPSTLSGPGVEVFTRASELPSEVWDTLEAHAVNANVILPALLTSLAAERKGVVIPNQRWLVFYEQDNPALTVEFVLSCTNNGRMGTYPIFIFTTHKYSALNATYLIPRLQFLAEVLHEVVPVERVYSVFAPEIIAHLFSDIWTNLTGVELHAPDPYYYAAKISFCSRRTLSRRQATQNAAYSMRPARMEDIEQVTDLCFEFALTSPPFILTRDRAFEEAAYLIKQNLIWVHEVTQGNKRGIACIAAFTRNSATVATITKVFTSEKYRRMGCAERLVRRVCDQLLKEKEWVVLFVGHDNPAAKVYARVGFAGLGENAGPVDGVDPWLEIGLDQDVVQRGHW